MKFKIALFLLISYHFCNAQLGMGNNATPNSSSVLDLSSNSKGLLAPRLTNAQRNAIVNPAVGLLIYNTDDKDFNSYNGTLLGWQDFATGYTSVADDSEIYNTSSVDVAAAGMTVTPKEGTYSVMFNGQFQNTDNFVTTATNRATFLLDLDSLIADLDNYFVSGTASYNSIAHTHYASYNGSVGVGSPISNEYQANYSNIALTLYPGAYYEGAAINFISGAVVTFDGLGDSNSKFIFKANAAINTGIGVTFNLINGAKSCNIFWLATGAMSIGATNEMKGNCVSRAGAIAVGIATNLEGRILTSAGALTIGHGKLSVPTGNSFINLKALVSFFGFTGAGDINITGAPPTRTIINGDLYTCEAFNNFGFTPPFAGIIDDAQPVVGPPVTITGKLYHCVAQINTGGTTVNNSDSSGTFSLYKNNVLISDATKTVVTSKNPDIITLQTIVSLNGYDDLSVRWKTVEGNTVMMSNRNLTLLKVQ